MISSTYNLRDYFRQKYLSFVEEKRDELSKFTCKGRANSILEELDGIEEEEERKPKSPSEEKQIG